MDKAQERKRDDAVEALRAELEGRADTRAKQASLLSDPFVAHGGKVPATPPPK